jgi:hypothetical protein
MAKMMSRKNCFSQLNMTGHALLWCEAYCLLKRGKKHPNNTQQNEGNPTALKECKHCQKNRHMKDQCWKLHLELILRNKQGKEYLMTKNAHMLQAELAKIEDLAESSSKVA